MPELGEEPDLGEVNTFVFFHLTLSPWLWFLFISTLKAKGSMSVSRWIQDTGNLLIITPVLWRAYGVVLDHSTVRVGREVNTLSRLNVFSSIISSPSSLCLQMLETATIQAKRGGAYVGREVDMDSKSATKKSADRSSTERLSVKKI